MKKQNKIKVLEVSFIDLPGKRFNGYDFIQDLDSNEFDVKQYVVVKQSKNRNVFLNWEVIPVFENLMAYESFHSIHNWFSVTSDAILNSKEYKECDIVHFHFFHNAKLSVSSLLKFSQDKKIIISLHDPWFLTGRCVHFYECDKWQKGCKNCDFLNTLFELKEDNCNLMWEMKRRIFEKIDVDFIVTSKWMENLLQNSPFLSKKHKVHYIPFGIDLSTFGAGDMVKARKKMRIPLNHKVLFFRAQEEFKGVSYIIEALKNIQDSGKITLLTCDTVGLIDELKEKYNIIELGIIKDKKLIQAYQACDIFLMPSKSESFGMMAIEAMACEKPVVIFDNTALPAVTFAPKCGYLVKNRDAKDLHKAIEYLLDNKEERIKRGKLGREICEKEYAYSSYIGSIGSLYKAVFNKDKKDNCIIGEYNSKLVDDVFHDVDSFIKNSNTYNSKINKKMIAQLTAEDLLEINNRIFISNIKNRKLTNSIPLLVRVKNFLRKFKILVKVYHLIRKEEQ